MPQTKYQKDPGAIRTPAYQENPAVKIVVTAQGKESHPVPPAAPGPWRPKRQAPHPVNAPGASGSI
jgi:hypothetical protein